MTASHRVSARKLRIGDFVVLAGVPERVTSIEKTLFRRTMHITSVDSSETPALCSMRKSKSMTLLTSE